MSRFSGVSGAIYEYTGGSFVKVLDVYEWNITQTFHTLRCDIKGDTMARYAADHGEVKFTAKRRYEGFVGFTAFLSDVFTNQVSRKWRLDLVDNNNSYTQHTVTGFATMASTNNPQDLTEETFELTVDGDWTYNV